MPLRLENDLDREADEEGDEEMFVDLGPIATQAPEKYFNIPYGVCVDTA